MARMSSGVSAFGWLKSKRRRSGATSEPFCVTWVPSRRRSASCSRCVAEWLARRAVRRSPSTRISSDVADGDPALGHRAQMDVEVAEFLLGIADGDLGALAAENITPWSPIWPPDSP